MNQRAFFLVFFSIIVRLNCFGQCPPCTNQTPNFTIPLPEDSLPYRVTVEQADFSLPVGLQSFSHAVYKGEWLFIGGRTNGLHNVDNTDPTPAANSFPASQQNTVVYVVNPQKKTSYSRSLSDPTSKLTQAQIDILSVTNALFYQTLNKDTLYIVGGYGIDTASQTMETKPALTAIDVPELIKWVKKSSKSKSASKCIRFAFNPVLQLTGGMMMQLNEHEPFLLAFGQNFAGFYVQTSEGSYSQQVRSIQIIDNGRDLYVQPYHLPAPLATYRRRDLNVVPIVKKKGNTLAMAYLALSGVFTLGGGSTPGAWTVPIEIEPNGSSHMLDPANPNTLAQAMNNYTCANVGLYSQKKNSMYTLLFGGISAAIFSDGDCENSCIALIPNAGTTFTTCCNLPFVNDISTIEIDKNGKFSQYLMSSKFPTISVPNPGALFCSDDPFPPDSPRIYYFGANAAFIPNEKIETYPNQVIQFDELGNKPVFIGYIVGGIASTILDTNCDSDTIASPYIFKVTISP